MYLLGADIGTSGCKMVLVDQTGQVLASQFSSYPLYFPKPTYAEQIPEDWWQGFRLCVDSILTNTGIDAREIAAIGLSGQMHGAVLLDKSQKVLRPCILWCDHRTEIECAQINDRIGTSHLVEVTGNPAMTGFTAPKLLWIREHEPNVYAQINTILLPKDYIRYRLTGKLATEPSDASGTTLLDTRSAKWSGELLDELNIPLGWFPPIYESSAIVGFVTQPSAQETGLHAETPVVAGAGDQAAQAVGTGVILPGTALITLGTSGVVVAPVNHPAPFSFRHAARETWLTLLAMHSAGAALEWFVDTFIPLKRHQTCQKNAANPYAFMLADCSQIDIGCEELTFLPFLLGDRVAGNEQRAEGAFCGITVRHTRAHFARAILEGVCCEIGRMIGQIRDWGVPINRIVASGGCTRSEFWMQMLTDIIGTNITVINADEGAAIGAALLAAVGIGWYPDILTASNTINHDGKRFEPNSNNKDASAQVFDRYVRIYTMIKSLVQ